jgi:hypothetical protein
LSANHRDFFPPDFVAPPDANGETEAAGTFGLSDFGLRTSRLPFCIPLAMLFFLIARLNLQKIRPGDLLSR